MFGLYIRFILMSNSKDIDFREKAAFIPHASMWGYAAIYNHKDFYRPTNHQFYTDSLPLRKAFFLKLQKCIIPRNSCTSS